MQQNRIVCSVCSITSGDDDVYSRALLWLPTICTCYQPMCLQKFGSDSFQMEWGWSDCCQGLVKTWWEYRISGRRKELCCILIYRYRLKAEKSREQLTDAAVLGMIIQITHQVIRNNLMETNWSENVGLDLKWIMKQNVCDSLLLYWTVVISWK